MYPSQEKLRELFDYDPEGFLVWKNRSDVPDHVNTRFAGEIAGCRGVGKIEHANGFKHYAEIRLNGERYRQHELVWIWHKGAIPEGKVVTHKSGQVLISKIEKLILVDSANSKPWQRNARFINGLVGVSKRSGKERVTYKSVASDGSHLGTFSKIEAAAAAYDNYARKRWGDDAVLNGLKCDDIEKYRITKKQGGQSKKTNNGRMLGCYFDEKSSYWYSKIGNRYLGTFYTEEQAARAYNIAAKEYYGDQAVLNDIPRPLIKEPVFRRYGDIKGVQKKGARYAAVYNRRHLGTYDTKDDAARRYNVEAMKEEGVCAHLNSVPDPLRDPGDTVAAPRASHGFRGVHVKPSGRVGAKFKRKTLGTFDTQEEAARAYNKAAYELYGDKAALNDIPDPLGIGAPF